MIQFETSKGRFLAVEVPHTTIGSMNIEIRPSDGSPMLYIEQVNGWYRENLPTGHTYTIIGIASDLTEEQWAGIVGERLIYRITHGLPIPADEPCGHSGCASMCDRINFAMLYEGEYSNEEIGAGMPVCTIHAQTATDSGISLLRSLSIPTTSLILKID